MKRPHAVLSFLFGCLCSMMAAGAEPELRVGFAESDITPDVNGKTPVWIAGYGHGRKATGVHDPLMCRGVVLENGPRKMAFVSVDLVGLQYPEVQKVRSQLADFAYVMVNSTHNHEGPDVIGIWGQTPFQSGVDPQYLKSLIEKIVATVRAAEENLVSARASYGTAEDETLLGDSRLPKAYDGVLRVIRFDRLSEPPSSTSKPLGLLVQWNCHPESLGSKNTLITADFPYATVAKLKQTHQCAVAYFTGTVGGLMAPPDDRVKNSQGELLKDGNFEYAQVYGEAVASLADQAIAAAKPIRLTPLSAFSKPITIPLANPMYQAAQALGVLPRGGRVWTGNFEELGEPKQVSTGNNSVAVETEVAYLRLGELHVACIPGEIYPELVYGKFQEPVDPNVDFPDAPLETPVMKLLPGDKTLLFGLANDEVGYIIPKRQWDERAPYAYGRTRSQYGEINSCGPEVAPILMKALENRVAESKKATSGN